MNFKIFYKKGGSLLDPVTGGLAIIGIFSIGFLFLLTFTHFQGPSNVIEEGSAINNGNILLINYLEYPVNYLGGEISMLDVLRLYKDSNSEDFKNLILENSKTIFSLVYVGDKPTCFFIYLDKKQEFEFNNECIKRQFEATSFLPYHDNLLEITIAGGEI